VSSAILNWWGSRDQATDQAEGLEGKISLRKNYEHYNAVKKKKAISSILKLCI